MSAVALGGALSALPLAARTASAGRATRRAATAPAAPTDADVELLNFARSVELAAVELYGAAADALGGEPAVTAQVIDVFRSHHRAYAQSLSGLLGRRAGARANRALVEKLSVDFGDPASAVEAALAFEEAVAATHLELLGELEGKNAATLVASMLVIEARHATALKAISAQDPMPTAAAADTKAALSATSFPVEG